MKICLSIACLSLGFHAALSSVHTLNAYAQTFIFTFLISAVLFALCHLIGSFLSWTSEPDINGDPKESRSEGPTPPEHTENKNKTSPRNHES